MYLKEYECASIRQNWLILYGEIIAVYCTYYIEHLCGEK